MEGTRGIVEGCSGGVWEPGTVEEVARGGNGAGDGDGERRFGGREREESGVEEDEDKCGEDEVGDDVEGQLGCHG